ncbi:unnamed protein product [Ostreobium quekettii]|uniref:Elongator complex protein 2 n=1 Tax=Ostreobium quekettii TaxID=121088 RepID=A0A8S1J1P3_9CHLO|nr:unnamed protein product [Ostreobium quekettii]
MLASVVHVAVGCNRVAGVLDWGRCGVAAFGAHHFVAIYDPKVARIIGTLHGHEGQVNCIKWVCDQGGGCVAFLLTGSADRTIRVWRWPSTQDGQLEVAKLEVCCFSFCSSDYLAAYYRVLSSLNNAVNTSMDWKHNRPVVDGCVVLTGGVCGGGVWASIAACFLGCTPL